MIGQIYVCMFMHLIWFVSDSSLEARELIILNDNSRLTFKHLIININHTTLSMHMCM